MMDGLSAEKAKPPTVMIEATSLEAYSMALHLLLRRDLTGRPGSGKHTKPRALIARNEISPELLMTLGQIGDCSGAIAL